MDSAFFQPGTQLQPPSQLTTYVFGSRTEVKATDSKDHSGAPREALNFNMAAGYDTVTVITCRLLFINLINFILFRILKTLSGHDEYKDCYE